MIGIGLQDKLKNRIATILKPVSFFNKNEFDLYSGMVEFPGSIIAPNTYSFVFVIWNMNVAIYDNVEDVCQIKIHDNGSELAVYDGIDYGCMILKPNWRNA